MRWGAASSPTRVPGVPSPRAKYTPSSVASASPPSSRATTLRTPGTLGTRRHVPSASHRTRLRCAAYTIAPSDRAAGWVTRIGTARVKSPWPLASTRWSTVRASRPARRTAPPSARATQGPGSCAAEKALTARRVPSADTRSVCPARSSSSTAPRSMGEIPTGTASSGSVASGCPSAESSTSRGGAPRASARPPSLRATTCVWALPPSATVSTRVKGVAGTAQVVRAAGGGRASVIAGSGWVPAAVHTSSSHTPSGTRAGRGISARP